MSDRSYEIRSEKLKTALRECQRVANNRGATLAAVREACRVYDDHLTTAVEFWRSRGDEKYVDAWRSAQESFADVRRLIESDTDE